ncbi:neuropeptide F receptor [Eurytemora carolleeae]|uniref:neuropeptide F receptor n=1 Tax=Eurytemora carolleeae TaxID=1294199 RepID=UPI000C7812C8|nr:neuropeptide F receptor [Eurytemora carolleeae]|eukprot:XP_023344207.1 neuropeptide F receptor-like [Eurytemora affinis]
MSEFTDDIEMGLNSDNSLDEYFLDNDTFGLNNSSNSTGGSNPELEMVIHSFTHDTQVLKGVTHFAVISAYTVLCLFSVIGNSLVMFAFMGRKQLRTARNIFIFNLAFSDLLFSLTIPFTALDGLSNHWPLGDSILACKFVKTMPCIAVFMSSLTIVAIALDRYRVIVSSSGKQIGELGAWLLLPFIFILSFILSTPVLMASTLDSLENLLEKIFGLQDHYRAQIQGVLICYEDWTFGVKRQASKHDRIWFTVYSSGIQFLIPLIIISAIYWRIYLFLKNNRYQVQAINEKQRKTNKILLAISITFCVSWLPFSVFCLLSEIFNLFSDPENMMLVFCLCHLLGLTSSCSNSILYAFLNDNFQKEIFQIFSCFKQSPRFTRRTQTPRERNLNQSMMVSMSHCSSSLIKKYRSSNKTDSAPSSQLNGSSGEIINGSRDHLLGNKEAVSFIPMIFNNNPDTCKGSNNCQSSKTLYGSTRVQGANSSNQEIADTYV